MFRISDSPTFVLLDQRGVPLSVPITHPASSRHEPVLVDESSQDFRSSHSLRLRIVDRSRRQTQASWCPLIQSAVRAVIVVVSDVFDQNLFEMARAEDEKPVQALSANGAHESFDERVRTRSSHRGLDDADALGAEHLVDTLGVN